jgi:hypothetical protein
MAPRYKRQSSPQWGNQAVKIKIFLLAKSNRCYIIGSAILAGSGTKVSLTVLLVAWIVQPGIGRA